MRRIKKEKGHIIFLHETHLDRTEQKKLNKFGYKNVFFSSYGNKKMIDVMILMSKTIELLEWISETRDNTGRYILIKGKIEDQVVNIYAPPNSNKKNHGNYPK